MHPLAYCENTLLGANSAVCGRVVCINSGYHKLYGVHTLILFSTTNYIIRFCASSRAGPIQLVKGVLREFDIINCV